MTEIRNLEFWENWLTAHGYSIDFDKDGLWAEDWIEEHKWKDVFELMSQYASEVVENTQKQRMSVNLSDNEYEFISKWFYKLSAGEASTGTIADALCEFIKDELLRFRRYINSNNYGHIDESDVQAYIDNKFK